ncbi:hypothetical protein EHS25_004404 [Saitozyma podzolica]|uniref:Protein-S-isoprenylcysteine O-methyltransferase n=1 Tax=Saitozyma podzolica TaxID=1890683 RepID=A0A427YU02_9TREE|nr:hypothetical protein EHS25_004404 [Saitozyma podzolica]
MSSSNGRPHISSPMATSSTAQTASQRAHDLLPHAPQYSLRGSLPNTPLSVSVISALLGGLVGASIVSAAIPLLSHLGLSGWVWTSSRLGWYGAAMGVFHLLEFWTTAGWNPQKLSVDAFLLNNTNQYWFAHAFGVAEYLVSSTCFPGKFSSGPWTSPVWSLGVIALLIGGQALRSLAMIHASTSFSHVVKAVKHDDHVLITHGVYAWSRHPSYAGFFYWAIATQLLLGNVLSTAMFALVLGRFFSARIKDEERHLVRFFGNDYVNYRKRVGTGLPFFIGTA